MSSSCPPPSSEEVALPAGVRLARPGRTPCTTPGCTTRVAPMAVPGNAPPDLAATELFAVDAYTTDFDARVAEVDADGRRVRLDRTAFYPGGGGQPHDLGTIESAVGASRVTSVRRETGAIWHAVEGDLPDPGAEVHGVLDWSRRHRLMRTHTALHILCGVIWADYGIPVTGGNM